MTGKYNGIVTKKLAVLEQRLAELRGWPLGSPGEFAASSFARSAVERALQVCVEVVIDIAERILAVEGRTPGETSFDNLLALQSLGGVASAAKYRPMLQFRNFVVHRYEYVDSEILYDIAKNKLGDFEEYIGEIKQFLARP